MATTEERLAFLEGTIGENSHMLNGIRDAIASLETRMERRFEQLEQRLDRRFEQVDARFAQVDARFAQVDARFGQMDTRFVQIEARFSQVDQRIDSIDAKMSRHFVWLVGILVTGLIAMLGVLGTITSALLSGRI